MSGGRVAVAGRNAGKERASLAAAVAAIPVPTAAQLDELYRQFVDAREDRTVLLEIQGWALRRYRGRILVERLRARRLRIFARSGRAKTAAAARIGWRAQVQARGGARLSIARLREAEVTVRCATEGSGCSLTPDGRGARSRNSCRREAFRPGGEGASHALLRRALGLRAGHRGGLCLAGRAR